MTEILKNIPKVDKLIDSIELADYKAKYKHEIFVKIIREILDRVRKNVLSKNITEISDDKIMDSIIDSFKSLEVNFTRPCVNGTGIVLNTGLGRAPMPLKYDDLDRIIYGYSTLEVDIESGKRGRRENGIERIIQMLTGAEAATVVNNNAAAVMICLNTLSEGKEAIISRGEQVEIGGSFRMPDIIAKSGCIMNEVGATNKTHLSDYENAISDNTGVLVKVHTSNYKVVGFCEEVNNEVLVSLGKEHKIPTYFDLGGGIIEPMERYGLPHEPEVTTSLQAGYDLVSFSGDKVLGGPQCGIIAGKKEYVEQVKKNPLMRAFRLDKVRLALLEHTLKIYLENDGVVKHNAVLHYLSQPLDELRRRAEILADGLRKIADNKFKIEVAESKDQAGSGTLPTERIDGICISLSSDLTSEERLAILFRTIRKTPVFGYNNNGKFNLAVRTITDNDFEDILNTFEDILKVI